MPQNKPTSAQKKHFARLVELGCVICSEQAEIHHCFTSMGCRKDHDSVIPLCSYHHRTAEFGFAIHNGKKEFEKRFGTERELIEKCNELLNVCA